jgi:NAD(P)-dependent dehydrogenase (short-subunit alcohol dehydrogenase family)
VEQAFADLVQSGHIRRPNVVMTCMRILIIGGSGVAGRPTAAKLIRRGHSVAILSRRGSGGPPGAQAFAGDITTGAGLDRALAGVDCVIDCANRTTTSRKAAVAYVTDTTQRLGRLGRAAGVGHHIVLSIVSLEAVSAGRQGGAAPTFPGAIGVVYRGCSDFTLLVVTGPGRGRLVEVNAEGFFAPHFHTDPDFLAWYERWLDFTLAGHRDLTWFADQMAGDEVALVATLLNDALATRRRAAACTFITYPAPSASLPEVLAQALSTEPHPAVRETILRALSAQGEHGRDRVPAALADPVPGVRSLAAILMTTNTPQGRRLSPQLRQTLGNHLRVEEDRSVRDTIQRMLDHSH